MNTAATDLTIANTIASQLGRPTLAMLGAHSLAGDADSLSFRIRGSRKVAAIVIRLDPSDTYTVEFYKRAPFPECVKQVASVSDVYVDSLHGVIEQHTGLRTSL